MILSYIIIKLLKTIQEKIKHYVHDKFLEGKKLQDSEATIFIVLKKTCQLRILYPAKTYFKNEGEKLF